MLQENYYSFIESFASPSVNRLLNLALVFLLTVHFSGCAYWSIARMSSVGEFGEDVRELEKVSLAEKYAFGTHWALLALLADNPGPESEIQRVFSITVALIGVAITSVVVGSASSMVLALDTVAEAKKNQLDTMSKYMRINKIPQELRSLVHQVSCLYACVCSCVQRFFVVHQYHNYYFSNGIAKDEDFLHVLPSKLRFKLKLAISRQLLEKIPMFKKLSPGMFIASCPRL